MEIDQAISLYEDFYIIEKGLSTNTHLSYSNDLKSFSSYLQEMGIHETENIDSPQITDFLSKRVAMVSGRSLNREKSVIKNFLIYCRMLDLIGKDFSDLLKGSHIESSIPSVLTRKQIETLFEHCHRIIGEAGSEYQYHVAQRNLLILEMLYALGLRVSELLSMETHDLEEEGWCLIHGKGGRTRRLPLLPQTLKKIYFYLREIRPYFLRKKAPCPYLLLNKGGKRLSRISVWKWVKEISRSLGIEENIHPHTFRHTFATHLLQNGADLRIIQELVGHSNIQTTEIYTHLLTKDIKQTFINYHPWYQ